MKKISIRPEMSDCVVLFGVVLFSALPYLFKLGFYSDDWGYQATLARFSGQGLGVMLRELLKKDAGILVRPVQAAYLVLGFKAFGRYATPYHLVNSVVLALVAVLLYRVLREVQAGRWTAFVVALVFGLLPHYTTDRFWISAHQATLSMAFALLGIYALLRSLRPETRSSKLWIALAVLALVLSILSYEVALGLIIASLVTIMTRESIRARAAGQPAFKYWGGVTATVAALLLVGIIKAIQQKRMISHGHFLTNFLPMFGRRSGHIAAEAIRFAFWTYGLRLPAVLLSLHRHSALSWPAVCSATIIALIVAGYLWRCIGPSAIPGWRTCLPLVAIGLLLVVLGFGLFFLDPISDFSTAGIDNRVVIASALGVPFVLAGLVGLASSILQSHVVRSRAVAVAIGLICGMNCLVLYGASFYWAGAVSQQSAILAVAANVPPLPKGSVLLLDGFCRYFGPAVVFETDWDTTGSLQLLSGDDSLTGDVISPDLRLHDAEVETTEGKYPYGDRLFVFNVQRATLTQLPSKDAASAYLRDTNPTQDSGCPAAQQGHGVKVF